MLNVAEHERLTVNQVAKRLKVHTGTVWRWVLRGVRGRVLTSHFVGGRRYISSSELEAFLRPTSPQRHSIARNQRAELAGIELDRRRAERKRRRANID